MNTTKWPNWALVALAMVVVIGSSAVMSLLPGLRLPQLIVSGATAGVIVALLLLRARRHDRN